MKAKFYLSLSLLCALFISTTWISSGDSGNISSTVIALPSTAKDPHITTQIQNWMIATVDSAADVGRYNALAVDSLGRPHISYYDQYNKDLKYARWTGSSWQIQVVDSIGDVGAYNSIALDAANNTHISYVDSTNCDLKYAWWSGSSWQIQIVDSISTMYCSGFPISVAVEQNGNAHIAYSDNNYFRLKYARWTGSTWQVETLEGAQSYDVSLALDSSNRPHIVYDNGIMLRYALREGNAWQIVSLTNFANPGQGSVGDLSLALDDGGSPHIAYKFKVDRGTSGLRYIYKSGNKWEDQAVDFEPGVHTGSSVSIALDESGRPHISYRNHLRDLKYAYFTGSNWIKQTIQSNVCFGGCDTPLALDANGNPHISFYEYNISPYVQPKLKYATRSLPKFIYLPLVLRSH